jgi:Spy/CpxP family protein refolding chaperone
MPILLTCGIAQAQSRSLSPEATRDLQLFNFLQQSGASAATYRILADGTRQVRVVSAGAWWTNTELMTRLGLTDDQKAKVQRAFENHRLDIEQSTASLDKEEAQLAKLLEAQTVDHNAVLSQVDRVTQARSEMERRNAVMTLEMREALTSAQWKQLPQPNVSLTYVVKKTQSGETTVPTTTVKTPFGDISAPAPNAGGGRGARGRGGQQ